MKRLLQAGVGLVLAACTSTALGQIVAGNDQSGTATIWLIDITGSLPNRALVTGTTSDAKPWGIAADEDNSILYWNNGTTLYKAPYDPVNPLVVTTVGTISDGSSRSITGLAYDNVADKLYGRHANGFFEINPNTAAAVQVFSITAQDFGGFDYNVADDAFYGLNDSTSVTVLPGGRGFYRINKPISSPTFTEVADYPGADIDVDGLAMGNGRAYMVNDNSTAGQGIYVYNLTGAAYETALANPFSATSGIFSGGAWAPGLLVPAVGANLSITKTDSPDPVVPPGGNITYTITVNNAGPDPATGVVVTDVLPGGVNFVSVDPPGAFAAGTVTANIGNLAVNSPVIFTIVVQTTGAGLVSNTATVVGNETDPQTSNNTSTATTTVRDPQADVSVAINDPADCTVGAGGTVSYTIDVRNLGTELANNVTPTFTLPPNSTFISSVPPAVPVAGVLTWNLGSIAPTGLFIVSVDVQAINSGDILASSATVSADEFDPATGNNSDSDSTLIQPAAPAVAAAKGVISTIATSPTSDVPGFSPAKFSNTGGIDRPYRSPNGQRWIVTADSDLATASDELTLVGDDTSFAVVMQEGVTTLDLGDQIGIVDAALSINNAGQYAFTTNTNNSNTAVDEVVVKWNGSAWITVAREGNAVDGLVGANYGTTSGGVTIQTDGTVSFFSNLTGPPTTQDTVLLTDDGSGVLAQEGITAPAGQLVPGTFWSVFDGGTVLGLGLTVAPDGTRYAATGQVGSVTANDKVAVVDNVVQIQEGVILPGSGFASPTEATSPMEYHYMEPNGLVVSYGGNADGQDWVLRNGVVIAKRGDTLTPSTSERWDDATYAQLFFYAAGNNACDVAYAGVTDSSNLLSNAAIVLRNSAGFSKVVVRENDPVDLNNNGSFDDGVYISVFRDDQIFISDDRVITMVARLRNEAEALCDTGTNDIGQPLIRVRVGVQGDIDLDGAVSSSDLGILLGGWTVNADGDLDCDGATGSADLGILLANWGRTFP